MRESYKAARSDWYGLREKVQSRATLAVLRLVYERLDGQYSQADGPTDEQVEQALDAIIDQVHDLAVK